MGFITETLFIFGHGIDPRNPLLVQTGEENMAILPLIELELVAEVAFELSLPLSIPFAGRLNLCVLEGRKRFSLESWFADC